MTDAIIPAEPKGLGNGRAATPEAEALRREKIRAASLGNTKRGHSWAIWAKRGVLKYAEDLLAVREGEELREGLISDKGGGERHHGRSGPHQRGWSVARARQHGGGGGASGRSLSEDGRRGDHGAPAVLLRALERSFEVREHSELRHDHGSRRVAVVIHFLAVAMPGRWRLSAGGKRLPPTGRRCAKQT